MKKIIALAMTLVLSVPAFAEIPYTNYELTGIGYYTTEYDVKNLYYTNALGERNGRFAYSFTDSGKEKEKAWAGFTGVLSAALESEKTRRLFIAAGGSEQVGGFPDQIGVGCVTFKLPNLEHISLERVSLIGETAFKGLKRMDYVCFGRGNDPIFGSSDTGVYIGKEAFSGCENLRTAMFTDSVKEISESVFENCPKLTVIGKAGTLAEEYANKNHIPFIPAVNKNGDPSTIVAMAEQTATVTINGVDIPAYTVNGSVYVGESVLKCLGVAVDWFGDQRITRVIVPQSMDWKVTLNTNTNPYSIAVYSTDVEFWKYNEGDPQWTNESSKIYWDRYNKIPALNVGNGESIIDVNALAEKVLY